MNKSDTLASRFGVLFVALSLCACNPQQQQPKPRTAAGTTQTPATPDCAPMTFDTVELPTLFTVSRRNHRIGVVTIDADQTATLKPSTDADPKHLAALKEELHRQLTSGTAMYRFMGDGAPGDYVMCKGAVAKGEPTYPQALKFAIRSHRFEVD